VWRRLLLVAAVVLVVLTIVGWIAIGPLLSPGLKDDVLEVLGQHFGGNAELQSFQVSFFPSPRVSGEGLVLRYKGRTDIPPLIAVDRFSASAPWLGMLKRPRRIRAIELQGLRLHIPPRQAGESIVPESLKSGSGGTAEGTGAKPDAGPVVIDHITSVDAKLEIAPKDGDKPPRVFLIHQLELTSVALDRPMQFTATLTNPKPPGAIETRGEFGPWAAGEPGDTPVRGGYTFAHADLGVFKGIAGKLQSQGAYTGTLDRISVKGTTTTPDFMLTSAGNAVALSTAFNAIVDGTNGNTWLDPVNATFRSSAITAKGGIVRTKDTRGREVALDAVIDKARIEDLLLLAIKGDKPLMTGAARIKTKIRIPPGDVDVIEKLELDGEFHIASARFTDVDVERSIAKLSRVGRGITETEHGSSVVSDLKARFVMRNGRIRLNELTFAVPGATVRLDGAYGIRSEALDFKGTLSLQASLSQTQTGFKAVLLKIFDPFFRKNGAGAVIPIKVEGSRSQPKFGLDVGRMIGKG